MADFLTHPTSSHPCQHDRWQRASQPQRTTGTRWGTHSHSNSISTATDMRPPAVQDLVAEAKQALLRHNFAAARQLLTEAMALHQSYKVGVESKPQLLSVSWQMPGQQCDTLVPTLKQATCCCCCYCCSSSQLHRLRAVASACLEDYEAALGEGPGCRAAMYLLAHMPVGST